MLVTNSHLMWWRSKHGPTWAGRVVSKTQPTTPSVHDLINAQVRYPYVPGVPREDTELCRTLNLLKLRAKREGDDLRNVQDLGLSPHSSDRRRTWCQRFLRKMRKAQVTSC